MANDGFFPIRTRGSEMSEYEKLEGPMQRYDSGQKTSPAPSFLL